MYSANEALSSVREPTGNARQIQPSGRRPSPLRHSASGATYSAAWYDGAIVTALSSDTVRAHSVLVALLNVGGLFIALVFAVMDYRSRAHWLRLQRRSNALAQTLGFEMPSIASVESTRHYRLEPGSLFVLAFGWIFALFLPLFRR